MSLPVSLLVALSLLLITSNPDAYMASSYPQCINGLIMSHLKDGRLPAVITFVSSDTNSEMFCNPRVVCVTTSRTVCIFPLSGTTWCRQWRCVAQKPRGACVSFLLWSGRVAISLLLSTILSCVFTWKPVPPRPGKMFTVREVMHELM